MNKLAIGPHPDDIEFGCGGSLLKYAACGHKVFLMVLTDGSFGGDPLVRKAEQESAAGFMGAQLFWGGYRDTELQGTRELIQNIDSVINQVKPDIVFLNFWADVHQDHRAAAQAAAKLIPDP
jgi:LmbE family N-acetylglucosaminyl deacetylase